LPARGCVAATIRAVTKLRLPRGTLWPAIVERTRAALATGALAAIDTEERLVEQAGFVFSLRRASTLAAKPVTALDAAHERRSNPFLPPDPALVVGEVSDTHLAVLNKFPVIPHHLLLVTRELIPQTAPLDRDDVTAMLAGLAEYPALAFYNGGEGAGASQPHKHLQVVPVPLVAGNPLPFERDDLPANPILSQVPGFAFAHALAALPPNCTADPEAAADEVLAVCRRALAGAQVGAGPYNLLCTSRRLLVVARAADRFRGVSVNSLGFAGSLFAKDAQQLALLASVAPLDVLAAVSRPATPTLQSQPGH
jgi:ATP adenylyltransferase